MSHPSLRAERGALAFNLSGMLLIAMLVALGAAYLLDGHIRALGTPAPAEGGAAGVVTRTLSGRELRIPAALLRHGDDAEGGFSSQVDLRAAIALPGLDAPVALDITLMPRSRVRPGAALLDSVYLHQFAAETRQGVPGLVGKPLEGGTGLTGETVWYDPLSANPFVAKCLDPVAPGAPARCLRSVVLPGGLGAVYAFDQAALAGWRGFDAAVERLLAPMGAW